MPRQRKTHLTLYLIKEGVDWDDVSETDERVRSIALGRSAELQVLPSHSTPPAWVSFFEGRVNAGSIQAFNASCAALLRVKHEGRVFGITFGHGRHLLKDGVVEQAFGLRVVLNAIDPQRIRTLDKDSLDVVGRRTREQVSKEDSIASFGLNVDQDLVRAVTGSTTDEELGKRLTGADALFLSVPNSFSSLALLLSKCLRLYRSTAYRTSFEWIDHIAPERDPAIVSPLEQRLLGHIRNKKVDKIWLAVPDVLDWSKVDGFRYAGWYDRDLVDDIYMPDFLDRYPDLGNLTLETLQGLKVVCIDANTNVASHTWRLYDCLYGEIEHRRHLYLLNSGDWFRVDQDFVAQVDRDIRGLLS